MFEQQYEKFLEEQKRGANGARLERLTEDLSGTKKMLFTVIWPVLKSFHGLVLEYEMMGITGVKLYIDVFYEPLGIAFECEGYVPHAQNITRDRFAFEKMRVRSIAMHGYRYIPFAWDELDKKPEASRRSLYELIGRYAGGKSGEYFELSVQERELIRYALRINRPLKLDDACFCLQVTNETARKVLRSLLGKGLLMAPASGGGKRVHQYMLGEEAARFIR